MIFSILRYIQHLRVSTILIIILYNYNWFLQEILRRKFERFFFLIATTKRNLLFSTYNLVSGQKNIPNTFTLVDFLDMKVELGIENAEIIIIIIFYLVSLSVAAPKSISSEFFFSLNQHSTFRRKSTAIWQPKNKWESSSPPSNDNSCCLNSL